MSGSFDQAMDNFLIVLAAIAVILILVVLLGSKNSKFRRVMAKHMAGNEPNPARRFTEFNREYYVTGEKVMRKPTRTNGAARSEVAVLVQKVDERRRTVDANGTAKLYNEYYELIFKTRKGEILHIVTTKAVYLKMPFHQQGTLQYNGEQFIRFQCPNGEVIAEKPTPQRRSISHTTM